RRRGGGPRVRSFWELPVRASLIAVAVLSGLIVLDAADAAQLQLTWVNNSTDENGFSIERSAGGTGTFTQIAVPGPRAVSYTDVGLADVTTYCYQVRAFNTAGYSTYTNEACATTGYTLTVTAEGSGGGTVTSIPSIPAGVSCGATCSVSYASGTVVTLTAVPSAGSLFAGWSGGGAPRP